MITIVIPTSPIPSNPETRIIDDTVATVRAQLPDAPVIITCDGMGDIGRDRMTAYGGYKDRLKGRYDNAHVVEANGPIHQSGMLSLALALIQTPLIYYLEHDWATLPGVPWAELSELILSGEYGYIKLHAGVRIHAAHEHLMRERMLYQDGKAMPWHDGNNPAQPIPIIKTVQFSANPHLASVEWYRRMWTRYMIGKTTFIEALLHGPAARSPWDEFRMGIYNPWEGDMYKVHHLDGRGRE